jgi:hypothetical protein
MAYNESTVGGTSGGQFRVWVNSIRTRQGNAADNSEDWRVEGGIKRVTSGSRIWNLNNQASYTVQLGMNGVAQSGNFSYDFASGYTGPQHAWGTGATRVNRNSAGVGFGFTSRMDINLANSPYLTSGWVTSSDSVATIYRSATLTALSMDAGGVPATDEGPLWLEFSNPGGATVQAYINSPVGTRIYTSANGVGSRFNFPNLSGGSLTTALQNAIPNSNTGTMRIGIYSQIGGHNTHDTRDRTYTIKNNNGQANPIYADFEYLDENATTVAITGSDQVLVQGKSDLKVTVPVADKATPRKGANMSSYLFSIGGYSQSEPWSNGSDVVKEIGIVSDVAGSQNLSVRAVDSRGNSTTVTKNVTILPYAAPGFFNNLDINYANDFDADDGLVVNLLNNTTIGAISPMTLGGVDKNEVTPTTGLRYTIAKSTGSYSGTWTNIPFTVESGTGLIVIDPDWLATSVEGRMNALTADNTVRWYIMFEVEDKFEEPQYYEVAIDVGRPFFRIGANGRLYYKEIEFFSTFTGYGDQHWMGVMGRPIQGTWTKTTSAGLIHGPSYYASSANNSWIEWWTHIPPGLYKFRVHYQRHAGGPILDFYGHDNAFFYSGGAQSTTYFFLGSQDTYNAATSEQVWESGNINVGDGYTYGFEIDVNGKNASASTAYAARIIAIELKRTG